MNIQDIKNMLTSIEEQALEELRNEYNFTEEENNPDAIIDKITIEVEKIREQIRQINEECPGRLEKAVENALKEYVRVPFGIHYNARDVAKVILFRKEYEK